MGEQEQEEPDYMSDIFVQPRDDVTPGLVTAKSIQRRRVAEVAGKQHQNIPKIQLESLNRTEGLKKQVGPENKGFNMLVKMGYAPGKGLGKNAEGRPEPISIEIQEERSGFGLVTARREFQEGYKAAEHRVEAISQENFRTSMADKFRSSRLQRQLKAVRQICQDLDLGQSIAEPLRSYYWPEVERSSPASSDQSALTGGTKRRRADHYRLRQNGIKQSRRISGMLQKVGDDSDPEGYYLEYDLPELSDEEDLTSLDANQANNYEPDVEIVLEQIVAYLRRRHCYCFWCTAKYTDEDDLSANCPGPAEDNHS